MEQIPVESLQAIDNLWLRASKEQFGYSVQKQIWLDIARNSTKSFGVLFAEFADQVGWLVDGRWTLSYDDFNFSLDAPDGHLPTFGLRRVFFLWVHKRIRLSIFLLIIKNFLNREVKNVFYDN